MLRLIFQEGGEDVKEPMRIVYKDVDSSNVGSRNFNGNLFQYKEKDVKLDDGLPEKNSEFIFSDHVLRIYPVPLPFSLNLVSI